MEHNDQRDGPHRDDPVTPNDDVTGYGLSMGFPDVVIIKPVQPPPVPIPYPNLPREPEPEPDPPWD
jgi:hypothetical protein